MTTPKGEGEREANIVDQSRAIIVQAISNAIERTDNEGSRAYLGEMRDRVARAEAAQIDSWLVLDAVILALKSGAHLNQKGQG